MTLLETSKMNNLTGDRLLPRVKNGKPGVRHRTGNVLDHQMKLDCRSGVLEITQKKVILNQQTEMVEFQTKAKIKGYKC